MRKILLAAGVLLTVLAVLPSARAGDDWEWWFYTPVSYKMEGDVKLAGPFGVTVAYRSMAKQSSTTGDWDNTNVLVTSAKLSF